MSKFFYMPCFSGRKKQRDRFAFRWHQKSRTAKRLYWTQNRIHCCELLYRNSKIWKVKCFVRFCFSDVGRMRRANWFYIIKFGFSKEMPPRNGRAMPRKSMSVRVLCSSGKCSYFSDSDNLFSDELYSRGTRRYHQLKRSLYPRSGISDVASASHLSVVA